MPYLDLEVFAELHPVGVEQADGLALLRIQPAQEVKRALAPWTRRFGTTVPAFTSLVAGAGELLGVPEAMATSLPDSTRRPQPTAREPPAAQHGVHACATGD